MTCSRSPRASSAARELLSPASLPAMVISKDRQEVDLTGPEWTLLQSADGGRRHVFKWARMERPSPALLVPPDVVAILRLYLAERLRQCKADTVSGNFDTLLRFFRWYAAAWPPERVDRGAPVSFAWALVTESSFRAYLAHGLQIASIRGNDFSRLRALYRWAVVRRLPGFDRGLSAILATVRAPGNVKGHLVRGDDPIAGPLTEDESHLVAQAFADGRGRDTDRALIGLVLEIGFNPNQYARTRNRELVCYETEPAMPASEVRRSAPSYDGAHRITAHQLALPRNKKRTVHRELVRRPISQALGALLTDLQRGGPDDRLLWWLADITQPARAIDIALKRFAHETDLMSPRTGERLHLSARRFRYTIATDAAEDGASAAAIAAILDHTDTQHVGVYVEKRTRLARRMGEATDHAMAPLVARFRGTVIDAAGHSPFPSVPRREIPGMAIQFPDFPLDVGGVGLCGRDVRRDGLCALFPPLSCYLCDKFAAYRDGPHERVLGAIEASMQAMATRADERIPAQLDWVKGALVQLTQRLRTESDGALHPELTS